MIAYFYEYIKGSILWTRTNALLLSFAPPEVPSVLVSQIMDINFGWYFVPYVHTTF